MSLKHCASREKKFWCYKEHRWKNKGEIIWFYSGNLGSPRGFTSFTRGSTAAKSLRLKCLLCQNIMNYSWKPLLVWYWGLLFPCFSESSTFWASPFSQRGGHVFSYWALSTDQAVDIPAHCRGVRRDVLQRSQTQTILWLYDADETLCHNPKLQQSPYSPSALAV